MQSTCMRLILNQKQTNLQEYRKYSIIEEPIHIAIFEIQKFPNLLEQQKANALFSICTIYSNLSYYVF